MKNLISIVLVVFSLYSCTDTIGDNVQNCGSSRNVAFESFDHCNEFKENPTKPSYVIINSVEDMTKHLKPCDNSSTLPDFTQKRILGITSGPKPTAGYDIKIQSVIEDDCQILVQYSETAPGQDAVVATVMSYPSDFIVLPKSDKPIMFARVNEVVDYAIVGTYVADQAVSQCVGDCNTFYKIENHKVLKYSSVGNFPAEFNRTSYRTLVFRDDYAGFISKVPTEIKNLKEQTKTYGTPGIDNHSGVYFEWSQQGVVTKVYLDIQNTTDQTAEIIAFKKEIQDKITFLKTKS